MNDLSPAFSREQVNRQSALALAHIGDGVYELMVRTHIASGHEFSNEDMHRNTLRFVSASAQAKAFELIRESLSEEEHAVFLRGRNAHSKSPKHTPPAEYHAATGLEALFGWLWLLGRRERLEELFDIILVDLPDGASKKSEE